MLVFLILSLCRVARGDYAKMPLVTINTMPFMYETDCCAASEFCSARYDRRPKDYAQIEKVWESPVVVSPRSLVTHSLGNGLITYYVLRALAHDSGQDFIYPYWKKDPKYSSYEFFPIQDTFLDFLPKVVKSQSSVMNAPSRDACFDSCSAKNGRIWPDSLYSEYVTKSIQKEIPKAVKDYYKSQEKIDVLQRLINDTDVCIHYRTGDILKYPNVEMMNQRYPLLRFRFIADSIPVSSRNIIIVSNDPTRGASAKQGTKETDFSIKILKGLVDYLAKQFPQANVSLSVQAPLTEDYARLLFAKTTICSSSTFCYFAAVAARGSVFTPVAAVDRFPSRMHSLTIFPPNAFVRLSEVMRSNNPVGVLSK